MTMLKVSNLSVHYGKIQALHGLDFEINQGEIVSLVGANGAGKTTTLRALSGLVPAQGQIYFLDKNISQLEIDQRTRIGIAHSPEGRGVFPQMTVLENLELGAYTRTDKQEIAASLDKSWQLFPRLHERRNQLAGTLSGGEQQMLAICRALMSKPKMLLLDEPSLGLAPQIVAQIFKIIVDLNREGMTVLLVEQNALMALKVSHRAYVLETGKILFSGQGQELLKNPKVREAYLGI